MESAAGRQSPVPTSAEGERQGVNRFRTPAFPPQIGRNKSSLAELGPRRPGAVPGRSLTSASGRLGAGWVCGVTKGVQREIWGSF